MHKGVLLSILASILFGVMYFYTSLLSPLTGEQIYGWRMLLTFPMMTLFMLFAGEWTQVSNTALRLRKEPKLWLALPVSSALLGIQLWLFLWAPLHNKALDVSVGYFMLPLIMVVAGRIIYKDHLSQMKKGAALSACIGVAHELYQVGSFSWASLLVAFGYPLYFILRRTHKTDHLGGLWFDMLLMLPFAYYFALVGNEITVATFTQRPMLYLLIPLLGIISAAALTCYILSCRYLSFSLFGLLGYVEPVLLVFVSLLLGETIGADKWLTYIPIWLAVGLLAGEGIAKFLHPPKQPIENRVTGL
jgi:chloramphenicol-sensitive protein RarD